MRKTLVVLCAFLPALAAAQEKYTNADLKRTPMKDAYTNADIAKLAPLPVTGGGVTLPPAPAMPASADEWATSGRQSRLESLALQRDLIDAEIRYQQDVIERATWVGSGPNGWPAFGSDSSAARLRVEELNRRAVLVQAEMDAVRFGVSTK
jgi:hypothetical protein